jgi:hypothetical protein
MMADHDHHEPPCEDCDLHGVDDLACESKGIADQAAYIAAHAQALKTRRAAYDTARTAYTTARADVAAAVKGIRKDLHQIREQLRCQIDDDVLECLDRAWYEVAERLEGCGEPATGCCMGDCDLDEWAQGHQDDTIHQLTARIARIDQHVTQAEACFDKLTGEPAAMRSRVTQLRTDLDALLAEIADTRNVDPRHAYATLRWLWHRFDDIWLGFPYARDFHDCLCRALTCSASGRRLLGIITGWLGVLTCRQEAEDTRCAWLRTHVVDEVLAICAKGCEPDHDDHHQHHDHDHHDHHRRDHQDHDGGYPRAEPGGSGRHGAAADPDGEEGGGDSGGEDGGDSGGEPAGRRGRSSW